MSPKQSDESYDDYVDRLNRDLQSQFPKPGDVGTIVKWIGIFIAVAFCIKFVIVYVI